MAKRKGGLGRGLGALIPQTPPEQATQPTEQPGRLPEEVDVSPSTPEAGIVEVATGDIGPNPRQPRQEMKSEELDELAASIREHGLLQPLVVTRVGGGYLLIAGERRWRAAILAGLERVPAVVKEASSQEMLELALVENLQRADLNSLEEAAAYRSLVEEFGLKHDEVAARVGKSRGAVANSLRLLRLPLPVQEALALGIITEGHARAILQVPAEEGQLRLLEHTVASDLSVRQVEALARRLAEAAGQPQKPEDSEAEQPSLYDPVRDLEDRFRNALGTKVQLSRSSRGGKLVIYFYSDEELDRIYGTIVGEDEGQ